jgi:hypothetical protein
LQNAECSYAVLFIAVVGGDLLAVTIILHDEGNATIHRFIMHILSGYVTYV